MLLLAGGRVWCGPLVETSEVEALMPWLTWAYAVVQGQEGG